MTSYGIPRPQWVTNSSFQLEHLQNVFTQCVHLHFLPVLWKHYGIRSLNDFARMFIQTTQIFGRCKMEYIHTYILESYLWPNAIEASMKNINWLHGSLSADNIATTNKTKITKPNVWLCIYIYMIWYIFIQYMYMYYIIVKRSTALRVNILRPRRNRCHIVDDIFKCLFFNKNVLISIKISLNFIPNVQLTIYQHWFR